MVCGLYNQYADEMGIKASASISTNCDIYDTYNLYNAYHNFSVEKENWFFQVIVRSALMFKFNSFVEFIKGELNREDIFAGEFIEDILDFINQNDFLSENKKNTIHSILYDEPINNIVTEYPSQNSIDYDVALSFAGEDRNIAESIASLLKEKNIRVFYDEDETLWGKDLYEYLADIYSNRAKYCIVFISQSYANKRWTNHERKNAQARAFRENEEYILPLRIDDTSIPGITDTTAYLDLRNISEKDVVQAMVNKLKK